MEVEYLMHLLRQWARWMRQDDHGLGYPKKSIGMSSGGESSYGAFDEMIEQSELANVKVVDTVIHDLDPEQRKAIYARFLEGKKPMYYEIKLSHAIDNLTTIVGRRIDI